MTTQETHDLRDPAPLADRRRLLTDLLSRAGQNGDAERLKVAPVSFGQRRLWLVDRLSPGGVDYNVVWPLRLRGELDVAALHAALTRVVARHEVLRTRFATVDGEPVAVIAPPTEPDLPLRELNGPTELAEAIAEQAAQPFDLTTGPLVRLQLLRTNDCGDEHVLLFAAHHIVFDGWSSSILLNELSLLYTAYRAGEPDPLPPLTVQYPDYAVWEREWLAGPVLAEQLDFWRDKLDGAPATMELPVDTAMPARRTGRGARHRVEYPPELADALARVCREGGATPFMGLLAVFTLLLSRHTGSTDVVVGTVAAGRAQPELEDLIGFFVNTVVLRTDLSGEPSFREVLARTRDTALGAFANQDVPFDRVVEELQPRRQAGSTPYLQAALVMQNTPEEATRLGDLHAESLPADAHTAAFDLSLHLWHNASGGLSGFVEYATDLFTPATAARLAGHFGALLREATAAPDRPAGQHPMLTADERNLLCRKEERKEGRAEETEGCLHQLVAAQAARRPDAVAAVCGDRSITYGELDRRANHLAYRLHRVGVRPDTVVGICVERSIDSLVAMLGVLKAGGAYLPLDPDNPPERVFYMLAHSGAGVVVAQPHLISRLPHGLPNLLRLDDWDPPATGFDQPPPSPVRQDNLAYVIYTSGSTGRPKGVGVTHRSAISRVHRPTYLDLGDDDVMLHALALSFDVSVLEVFGALTNGCRLAVLSGKALPERVCEFLVQQRVTVGWLTAALFHAVVETDATSVSGMRTLIAGGDQLSTSHTERALENLSTGRLVNGYGPTEATVFATTHTMHPAPTNASTLGRVPIGAAIQDTSVLVLDRQLNPTPVGVAGELYLGGGCLARGYLHRPDLTADRFVPHPLPENAKPGARLYRTGDVVRWRDDGTLVFLGRVDHQVKIRGFRVELGEIEQVLRRHGAVREAVVVARPTDTGDDNRVLVAYVQCAPQQRPGPSELLAYTRQHLPDYMVPALFVSLDSLPLNPNGKVDRAALPEPEGLRPDLAAEYVPPRNPIEETLAAIWAQVLDLDRVGVHDNFFDVGGHSLLASRLAARVRKAFAREVPLDRFLAAPTIATLAGIVEAALRSDALPARPPITPVARDGNTAPVSFGQRRLWLVDQLSPGDVDYNVVWPMRLVGDLDRTALHGALREVLARHEVLRTRFTTDDAGEPVAIVDPPAGPALPLPLHDLSGLPASARAGEVAAAVSHETSAPFDLTTGPLLRTRLLRVADTEHVLIVAAHHIVFDGWSASILLRELSTLYAAARTGEPSPLPPLPVQYADYAAWERQWLSGPVLAEQLDHWRDNLTGAPDTMELPVDRPRPVRRSGAGARERVEFPAELTEALTALCRAEGATLFMGLLAVFNVVLGRYSRGDDVLVGTFAANRAQPELEELVGFFVNTLVLRTDLSGEPTFREVLARGRATALAAFAHQDLPFDRVVEELHPRRQPGSMPYLQAALVMQNTPQEATTLGDLAVESLPTDTHTATFDVSLYLWRNTSGGLSGYIEYATDLFTRDTVSRIAGHVRTVLRHATAEPDRPISALPLLTPHEAHRLERSTSGDHRVHSGQTLVQAFEEQAAATPDAVAFSSDGTALRYAELDRRATLLARRLRHLGVGQETPVGVHLGRGLDLPVALLGILKAGGAYLPLDPDNPPDRLHHMIVDAGAEVVVTRDRLPGRPPPGLVLQHPEVDGPGADGPLEPLADKENIAAVIYTSGSTGRPKGVALTHRSIMNRIGWMWAQCPPVDGELCCLKTPTGFVDSLWELLGPLLAGVPSVIPTSAPRDADAFVDELAEHGVTRLLLVPSLLRMLLQTAPGLRERLPRLTLWVSSGEPLLPDLHRRFGELMPGCALHNLYGASEVWDALWPADGGASAVDGRPVPVGTPITGVTAHLLDRHLNPVPVGVTGELYVGGACLARGYLHRPDLTAERFVPHPGGARLYRTGDLGRWRDDGQIELLGRADDQVKIRGFRVEPAEVETALESLVQVKQAAVRTWADPAGDTMLAAYLVAEDDVSVPGLRAALAALLPAHLVPTGYVLMPDLPLTATGKIDRRALPEPTPAERGTSADRADEPCDALERAVAGLWAEVLHRDRVGVHDDFFDIGGHSLLAPVLVARVGELLGRDLPVRTVFDHPTVRAMAVALRPEGSTR